MILDLDQNKMPSSTAQQQFPLVGVGASAGGIDSFQKFLAAVPANSGMAYILVQHLSPSHESILPEILSRTTGIPVREITDGCQVDPDHIYVIPENKMLEVTGRSLKLTPREKNAPNMPIDFFFSSLARAHGAFAIGVVLSGTARDGTVGLREIKEHGGITFAEDPRSATWDGMPKSAIDAGVVDFVLPVGEIPSKLINVTSFFRDPEIVGELGEKVLPRLLKGRAADEPVRIWVPACASGEEAYSLAMALFDTLGGLTADLNLN